MNTSQLDKEDNFYRTLKYTMARYIKKNGLMKWEELNPLMIENFSKKWIDKASKKATKRKRALKGYLIGKFIYYLMRIVEAETKQLVPKIIISRIKRTINRYARPILSQNLQITNRAKEFKISTIKYVIKKLLSKNREITDSTAVCLAISFSTAARLADVLNIHKKDIKFVKNKDGSFIKILLRSSKNNQLGIRPEQLTHFIEKSSHKINLLDILKTFLKKYKNNGPLLIRLEKSNKHRKLKQITYQYKKISKELNLKNTIGAHSGRNTILYKLCKSKTSEESKKIFMRWRPNSNMPAHYRGVYLECSNEGAAKNLNFS
jgi:hypothetical protein